MTQEKKDRISELTRISRARTLTAEEQAERAALRQEYLAEWRRGAVETLESVRVVTPDGKEHKLKKKVENIDDYKS
jgi:uncharacterized protein YnzC (UPF0291/DUF896 family)